MAFTSMGRVRQRVKAAEIHWKNLRSKFRRALRQKRALVVALLAVSGLVAVLTGISMASGNWHLAIFQENPPSPRFGAATTYDQNNQQFMIFGGFIGTTSASSVGAGTVTAPPIVSDGKTWILKGGKWLNRNTIHAPSPRGFAAMAYDGARRNVVLFGGAPYNSNAVSGETWTWDGEDWTLQDPPKPAPDPRQNAVIVYDAHRKVVMMFGGRGADGKPMNDTWTWNGSAWKIVPRSAGDPTPRHSAAIAYDVCRAEAVMFGGLGLPVDSNTGRLSVPEAFETWTWDGAKWTPQSPKLSPPSRIGASMAYSPRTGNVLLYGGLITNEAGVATVATDTDVWRWSPSFVTGWERMRSEAGLVDNVVLAFGLGDGQVRAVPPPRAYASFENIGGDYFWLFGGTPSTDPGSRGVQLALGDQYGFSGTGIFTSLGEEISTENYPGSGRPDLPQNPFYRRCTNPVPIPDDVPGQVAAPEGPKYESREGMREIGKLSLLFGADWPFASRNPKNSNGTPNPNYKPAPDCPNRSTQEKANAEDGSSTHLITDQKRNRAYQFFICDPTRGTQQYGGLPEQHKLLIQAYDGATLKPLGAAVIRTTPLHYTSFVFDRQLFHDEIRGRFLLVLPPSVYLIQQDLIEKGSDPVVGTYDVGGLPAGSFGDVYTPTKTGFFNHPKTGRAKLLVATPAGGPTAGPPPAQSTPPKLLQWDLESKRQDWVADLTGCSVAEFASMRTVDRAYTTCSRGSVARVAITENAGGTETPGAVEVFSGPAPNSVTQVWGDPQTERVLLNTSGGASYTLWVFDGKASRWVGRTGIGDQVDSNTVQFGFDDDDGRFYVHQKDSRPTTQGGIKIIDTRLTPVPQPLKFPQFASPPASPVASLPSGPGVPRRILIRVYGGFMAKYPNWEGVNFDKEMFYRVLADDVPVAEKADLAQLDALTIPVVEHPTKTEVSFDAEGSSYGIRLRSLGGIYTAVRPFQQAYGGLEQWEGLTLNLTRHMIPACMFPDRELMAGWVPQARLSELDALARSSGLEVDSNSKTDLTGPFSRCNPTANASNFPATIKPVFDTLWPLWQMVQSEGNKAASTGKVEIGKDADGVTTRIDTPLGILEQGQDNEGKPTVKLDTPLSTTWDNYFKEVECVGDALKDYQAAVGNIYGSANCVQTKGKVEATARGSATGAGPTSSITSSAGFSVAEGYSRVEVIREPGGRGVVVTSTAVAKGIQLPGASFGAGNLASLSIDRVETKAVAWSNGRPGEERALFTRIICGVHDPEGRVPNGCLTTSQQQQFVDNWNKGWGINSKMYLPKPDPEYYLGSPGGYIAGVIKPVADETEDFLFAKDFQREVPGLVIDFYKDSQAQGNARQTLQLAAVRAVAGLGVQCNPDLLYSPQANDCVALPDDLLDEEFFEEDEEEFLEDEEEELDGEWIPAEALQIPGESIGKKIGRFIQNLPVIRQLPIRQMGEALLAGSVWVLLGLPLLFAWRRLSLNMEVGR